MRAIVLARDPACVMCLARGVVRATRVADHLDPSRKRMGDRAYFFNSTNCQGLCFTCHNSEKQKEEQGIRSKPT